ncbi:MAG: thiol-disulfide oxidoreductase DCC family protein [Candidatus Scalinduaceae bacterium]
MVKKAVLIYDTRCSLCCGCMRWIKLREIRKDTFEFIPCQSDEHRRRFPEISEKKCLDALHLVLPDERILVGDKSIPEILSRLRYFRWLAILFKIPIIHLFSYAVYRFIANNRYIISRTILPLTQEDK